MMQAIEIASFGAPEVLRVVPRTTPSVGPGEALIRVAAAGVNRPDVLQRKGLYPVPADVSDIPGLEVAGVLVDGDLAALQAAGFALGDRVCALVTGGGYAQMCVAPVAQCLPVPAGLTDVQAASLPETLFTVWSNLIDRAQLAAGQSLLIHGGTSGIGVMAIQIAKAMGVEVLVTAGTEAKCAACLALGADHAINYQQLDFAVEVQRITEKRGVHVILDMVAGPYVARELPCLAPDGRLVIIAVQGGVQTQVDAGLIMRRRLTITGSMLRPQSVAFKAAITQALRRTVWPWLESGRIKPVVHQVFPAEQAAEAHALMESGQHIGKLVLLW
jgi:NADPH:quinone reductase